MKVIFNIEEIETAILQYAASQGLNVTAETADVHVAATDKARGSERIVATLDWSKTDNETVQNEPSGFNAFSTELADPTPETEKEEESEPEADKPIFNS